MRELMDQFKCFEMSLPYNADGPDCIEGGITVLDEKLRECSAVVDTISARELKSQDNRM